MKYQHIMIGCLSALLLGACDDRMEEMSGTETETNTAAEVLFTGYEDAFGMTRAEDDRYIGKDGKGANYGTIYMRQIEVDQLRDGEPWRPTGDTHRWGHYKVAEGKAGILEPVDADDHTWHLVWKGLHTNYHFQALSVPVAEEGSEGGVTFSHATENGGETHPGEGMVTFGGFDTGLEYFVGCITSVPRKLFGGQTIAMLMRRQVCKIAFWEIKHKDATGNASKSIDNCEIIFPNLYRSAKFDMTHYHRYGAEHEPDTPFRNISTNYTDFITFDYTDQPKGLKMDWTYYPRENTVWDTKQALYTHPFKFRDNGNMDEDQSGFFIVKYDGKTYSGNIEDFQHPNGQYTTELIESDFIRLVLTLQDGAGTGGGNGSIIIGWNIASGQDAPHYPVHGVYSAEDAEKLLAALRDDTAIPERFYTEIDGKKVIRLFTNIDWSAVNDKLTIPSGYVLSGQGYNINLGSEATIEGNIEEGTLYINGKKQEQR